MIIPQTNPDCPSMPEADSPSNSFLNGSAGFTGRDVHYLSAPRILWSGSLGQMDAIKVAGVILIHTATGNDSPSSYGSVVYNRKFPISEASSSRVPSMESLRSDNNGHNGTPHKQKTLVPPKMSSRSIK
ncbi:hypothetical protein BDQ12DRAFT_722937 [Crucibulum laeve]|uniref:Uncharacterized protein n=1 Tax=Crucibulum laeve TaxID=68775 RepID=A0A5C3M5I5_9AGAR|nr:hypothetical protein BDQ12DRAFT_722937 [Crucibulum laeve]